MPYKPCPRGGLSRCGRNLPSESALLQGERRNGRGALSTLRGAVRSPGHTSASSSAIPGPASAARTSAKSSRRSTPPSIAGRVWVFRLPAPSWRSTRESSASRASRVAGRHSRSSSPLRRRSPWSGPTMNNLKSHWLGRKRGIMPKNKVLIIDDEKLVRWSLQQKLIHEGYEVETTPSGEEGLNLIREDGFDLVLLDLRLPGMDGVQVLQEIKKLEKEIAVVVLTADSGIARAVECVRFGAHNYLCKPFEFDEVRMALEKAREELKLRREVTRLRGQQRRKFGMQNLVGDSAPMRAVRELIARMAGSDATTALITGENGTGKELAARAIHFGSARANQ